MRKYLPLFVLGLCLASPVKGQGIKLGWDNNTEEDLAGYHGYNRVFPQVAWTRVFTTTTNSATHANPSAGLNEYYVTAFNTSGLESLPSNIVSTTVGPPAPKNFRIELSFKDWTEMFTYSYPPAPEILAQKDIQAILAGRIPEAEGSGIPFSLERVICTN